MTKRSKITFLLGTLVSIVLISVPIAYSDAAQPAPTPGSQILEFADSNFVFSMPVIYQPPDPTPIPPEPGVLQKTLICSSPGKSIPDNNQAGISSIININDPGFIADLDVRLDINHSWVGDLAITLRHEETGKAIELLHRPGSPPGTNEEGCQRNNVKSILDDDVSLPVEDQCSSYPAAAGVGDFIEAAIAGTYLPNQPLATFNDEQVNGIWSLTVADLNTADTGRLNQWCLAFELISSPGAGENPPPPTGLPRSAQIYGVTGQGQALPLDCESRSAVDWANYFNVGINELEFFNGLPTSDNPDRGFVGSVYGRWGQIPPSPYGVHAEPIAKRLRQYGLPADAERYLTWNHLKAEIAAGRPVIVWILGSTYSYPYDYVVNGIPEYSISSAGELSIVARYEHTVVLTGYTQDTVSYLNGGTIYEKNLKQFLESWSALGNMAVIYNP